MAGASVSKGGTVLVWITETLDIMMAQQVARAMGGSFGLDNERAFAAMVDVSEKGRALLAGGTNGGMLVLKAHFERGRRILSVHAVDALTPRAKEGRRSAREAVS